MTDLRLASESPSILLSESKKAQNEPICTRRVVHVCHASTALGMTLSAGQADVNIRRPQKIILHLAQADIMYLLT
jgi:hypothetical protein